MARLYGNKKLRKRSKCLGLSKAQRLACLRITVVIQTTPTATLQFLIDLPPLHVVVETIDENRKQTADKVIGFKTTRRVL